MHQRELKFQERKKSQKPSSLHLSDIPEIKLHSVEIYYDIRSHINNDRKHIKNLALGIQELTVSPNLLLMSDDGDRVERRRAIAEQEMKMNSMTHHQRSVAQQRSSSVLIKGTKGGSAAMGVSVSLILKTKKIAKGFLKKQSSSKPADAEPEVAVESKLKRLLTKS
jgi:hypothetical protein